MPNQFTRLFPTFEARFWSKVDKNGPLWNGTPCWVWLKNTHKGYGRVWIDGHTAQAHRVAYELAKGPIPAGLTLDHLCRNHSCVNYDHLEPVTVRENTLRGESLNAINLAKTHCPQGHPYDAVNTYRFRVGRYCRTCHREGEAKRRQKRRIHATT